MAEDAREHEVTQAALDEAHRVDGDGEDKAAATNGRRKEAVAFLVLRLRREERGGEHREEDSDAMPKGMTVLYGAHQSGRASTTECASQNGGCGSS